MAARKSTVTYLPVSWGSVDRKSSITGTLESVIHSKYYNRKVGDAQQGQQLFEHFRAGPSEYLSGIDLLKRRGHIPGSQPSLQRLSLLEKPLHQQLQAAWNEYRTYIIDRLPAISHERIPNSHKAHPIIGHADGALLFEEHLIEYANKDTVFLKEAGKRLKEFTMAVNDVAQDMLMPDPYYAIVVADGDRIGETIDKLAQQGSGGEPGYRKHQEFSSQVATFAGEAKRIVQEHQGTPIYAGGDDVLALVPLHTLLSCTTALAQTFRETLAPVMTDQQETPTLSLGVAIVHHLSLLQESLALARNAEQSAKGVKGKNALAILVSKRGGEQVLVKGPREEVTTRLEQYITYHRAGALPYGMAYELRTMYQRLLPIEQSPSDSLKEVIWSNAKRILKRKLELPESKVRQAASTTPTHITEEDKKQRDQLAREILLTLLKPIEGCPEHESLFTNVEPAADAEQARFDTRSIPLPEFINELIVARALAGARQVATGESITLQAVVDKGIRE